MSAAVVAALSILIVTCAVCAWLWGEPLQHIVAAVRRFLASRSRVERAPNIVPLDDQPAWYIDDLARRLAGGPPLA